MIVAIDGPSASGKSTVAKGVAQALGLPYLDTGSTYRAVTWAVLERGVDPHDPAAVSAVTDAITIEVTGPGQVAVDGCDVSTPIRGDAVNRNVSAVSAHAAVRARLVAFQRSCVGPGGAVVEGRDIGTVVFPDADVKIFLTAEPGERQRRRGEETAMARRDRLDSQVIPHEPAPDAVVVDTTGKTPDEVLATVLDTIRACQ